MLDIIEFLTEKGGDPEKIKESERKRGRNPEVVDQIINKYKEWTHSKFEYDELNKQINNIQKQISILQKEKKDFKDLINNSKKFKEKKEEVLKHTNALEDDFRKKVFEIGNIIHSSVIDSLNEDDNEIIKTWKPEGYEKLDQVGSVSNEKAKFSHHNLLLMIDGYDPERGVKIVGHRGFFLKNIGVFLNQALINYGLSFLYSKKYTPIQTPVMMDKPVMSKTAQLSQFDEELYKVLDGEKEKYLIATSEQPISAYHMNEWFHSYKEDLPLRYAGYSACFRKEAGKHGKDAWGLFRIHHFHKIEQFVLTEPEDSWNEFENMIQLSEEFYQNLKLPYRIVSIVSGELNNAASKKYDLEAWFPFQKEYKELVSCSNCTDYQSRNLDIKYGAKSTLDFKKKFVHCLNATLCATERTLCCILENYQTKDGIIVPEVLRKYIPGEPEFLPFTIASDKKVSS